jgi:hypothetical protein
MGYLNHILKSNFLSMKKLYFLAAILSIGIVNTGLSQYTAIRSGNWSNPITWDPSGIPSTVCNSCTVTINSGVTVKLDEHVELAGSSFLYIGDGGVGLAEIVIDSTIHTSSPTSIATGFNIVLDTVPGNSMIVFRNSSSIIDATLGSTYDGIMVGPLPNSVYQKVIGNKPSLFIGDAPLGSSPPAYGQSLAGPVTLFSGGTLPIILTNFNAVLNDNVVNVTWSATQETNLSHFVVLRSGDGSSWEQISKVAATGSSSATVNYAFTDPSPLQGINYYRVQSVDNDGKSLLSEVKLIRGLFIKGLRFGPNPTKDNLHVTFGSDISSNVILRLLNQYGQVLQQKQLSNVAGTTVLFNLSNIAQGVYTLHIKGSDGSQSTFRVLVAH